METEARNQNQVTYQTEARYLMIKPGRGNDARALCEKLDRKGTPEYALLQTVLPNVGAKRLVFAEVEHGQGAEMVITIKAVNVAHSIEKFKSAGDPDSVKLRRLLNDVLATLIENDPCPL